MMVALTQGWIQIDPVFFMLMLGLVAVLILAIPAALLGQKMGEWAADWMNKRDERKRRG